MTRISWPSHIVLVLPAIVVVHCSWIANTPGCFDGCSDQVNCTVEQSHSCNRNVSDSLDFGGKVSSLNYTLTPPRDGKRRIKLTWRPPQTGSYKDVKGFSVWVMAVGHTVGKAAAHGSSGSLCYKLTPAVGWHGVHRDLTYTGGVSFYLNCMEIPAEIKTDLHLSVHTEPMNANIPQERQIKIHIEPDREPKKVWRPQLKKWMDEENIMHLQIRNPLKEAFFYEVTVIRGNMTSKQTRVSHRNYSVSTKDDGRNLSSLPNAEGWPHFLIPGLEPGKQYMLYIWPKNKDGQRMQHYIMTNPFKLSAKESKIPAPQSGTGNTPVIIGCLVTAVGLVVVITCVLIKVCRGPCAGHLAFMDYFTSSNNNSSQRPRALVIFYKESENFLKAVENHLIFLQHYVDVVSIHEQHGGLCRCCPIAPKHTWIDREIKDRIIVIYMSPCIRELMGTTDLSQVPGAAKDHDDVCLYALQRLRTSVLQSTVALIRLVTFDCFDVTDSQVTITDFTVPGTTVNLPVPLEVAKPGSDGSWKLTNIDQLLLELRRYNDFPDSNVSSLDNWRVWKEVREAEKFISLCGKGTGSQFTRVDDMNGMNDDVPLSQFISQDNLDSDSVAFDCLDTSQSVNVFSDDIPLGRYDSKEHVESASVCVDSDDVSEDENTVGLTFSSKAYEPQYGQLYVEPPRLPQRPVFPPAINCYNSASTDSFYSDLNKVNLTSGWGEPPFRKDV
ncbi:uncharacterized protein LOC101863310 [Aplysia californica]|uniref:Uncharacterized protein LOC101863310 n=1 Tax=Aplysia californica TaxID=6500 RepID=A0ABM0ZVC4_APLCA|nr:uncharacterized protein LOC101863310 [Aplysia californica]